MHEGNEWMVFGLLIFCSIVSYAIGRTIKWNAGEDKYLLGYHAGYRDGYIECNRNVMLR